MALSIFSFLCGVVLSFRFTVVILVPAILLGWILVLAHGVFAGNSGTEIFLELVLVNVAAQSGYLAGVIVMWIIPDESFVNVSGKPSARPPATA
jgi:hypothetical protein